MKKTFTINLGGQVFNIDDDAYMKLNNYLSSVEHHFRDESDKREISDIESRIAELFVTELKPGKQVISLSEVDKVIGILGKPEEIGEDAGDGTYSYSTTYSYSYRRIYRDPDNRIIGGVCSGISAYFHMDPLILRIVFLVAFFGFGVGLLIYIILWIVIPEAKTTAQKLEMRGEPVTITNIGKSIRNEFNNVKKKMKQV